MTTIIDLSKQYEGKRLVDFILYSYRDAKNFDNAAMRFAGLQDEIKKDLLFSDADAFMNEEIFPFMHEKKFWTQDAGDFINLFYDYYVLGYGDKFKPIPSDKQIFSIFNFVTYFIVLSMYQDKGFYKKVKKYSNRFFVF